MLSNRIHSTYRRVIADLPIIGATGIIEIQVRKFFCINSECKRKIFCERIGDLARPYGRRTERCRDFSSKVAFSTSCESASRVCGYIGIQLSPDTLLRIIRSTMHETVISEYIGIDDWAYKRNEKYGTLICDLISHKPMAVLEGRSTEVLEKWLRANPPVKLVSRDRASSYTCAINNVSRSIIQVADRFHLYKNLLDAVKSSIERHMPVNISVNVNDSSTESINEDIKPDEKVNINVLANQKKRYELAVMAKELESQGYLRKEISKIVGVGIKKLRKYLAGEPECLAIHGNRNKGKDSMLDNFQYEIEQMLETKITITQIFQNLRELGYEGKYTILARYCCNIKGNRSTNKQDKKTVYYSSQDIIKHVWCYATIPEEHIKQIRQKYKEIDFIREKVAEYRKSVKTQNEEGLIAWIHAVSECKINELKSFAIGLMRDIDAVVNSLKYPFSNGLLEGQVNRLKTIKRVMYGRGKYDLLRSKVLFRW